MLYYPARTRIHEVYLVPNKYQKFGTRRYVNFIKTLKIKNQPQFNSNRLELIIFL